ncbi:Rha family transcriptional regulator [Enterococcus olivae]
MTNLVIMKDQQAVTTSLQVAEGFEKQHKDVMRAIENKFSSAQNYAQYQNMFAEGTYQDKSGKNNKMYYMNRDGFTFIAMGFTGRKADEFKLKYIEAFNQMEEHIKQQLDTSNLSPELQMFQGLFQAIANQELSSKRIESKVDSISDIVALNTTDWRNDSKKLIRRMANKVGGDPEAYREIQNAIYLEVDRRAKADLGRRLSNLRDRMAGEGVSKSRRDKTNKLDVIESDKRLLEIYLAIVKEFAIKYKVWNDEF